MCTKNGSFGALWARMVSNPKIFLGTKCKKFLHRLQDNFQKNKTLVKMRDYSTCIQVCYCKQSVSSYIINAFNQ